MSAKHKSRIPVYSLDVVDPSTALPQHSSSRTLRTILLAVRPCPVRDIVVNGKIALQLTVRDHWVTIRNRYRGAERLKVTRRDGLNPSGYYIPPFTTYPHKDQTSPKGITIFREEAVACV